MERIIRILSIQLIDLKRHGAEMLGKLVMERSFQLGKYGP